MDTVTGGPICPDCRQIIKNMIPPCDCTFVKINTPMCEICGSQNLKSLLPRATCAKHEGMTLIGTCRDCRFWGKWQHQEVWGNCKKRCNEPWFKNDGCRLWEEKEKP